MKFADAFPFTLTLTADATQDPAQEFLVLRVVVSAVDVNTGFPTNVYHVEHIDNREGAGMSRADATCILRRLVKSAIEHETDECLSIDGQRWDPHAKDRR